MICDSLLLMPVVFKLHMIKTDCNFYEVKADFKFRFLEESVELVLSEW